jgi:hypothetical protein
MGNQHDHQAASSAEPAGLVPTRLYPGGPVYWVGPAKPLGEPRPGHGTLYVNPASDNPGSEWHASWEDDYPKSQIKAHGGATAGVAGISGSEEDVLRWARASPAKKHLIIQRGKWVPMPLDENWRPGPRPPAGQ